MQEAVQNLREKIAKRRSDLEKNIRLGDHVPNGVEISMLRGAEASCDNFLSELDKILDQSKA